MVQELAPLGEFFEPGKPTPIDILYFQAQEGEAGSYYLIELTMFNYAQGMISVVDLRTHERVLRYLLDVRERGLQTYDNGGANAGLDAFVLDNYIEWCGKWHSGIHNYWKFCTGSDCTGPGSVQWCIKKVDKEACKLAGNCPSND